jgi:hypothetical protein
VRGSGGGGKWEEVGELEGEVEGLQKGWRVGGKGGRAGTCSRCSCMYVHVGGGGVGGGGVLKVGLGRGGGGGGGPRRGGGFAPPPPGPPPPPPRAPLGERVDSRHAHSAQREVEVAPGSRCWVPSTWTTLWLSG